MQYVKFRKNGEVYLEFMNWNLWWGCRDGVYDENDFEWNDNKCRCVFA